MYLYYQINQNNREMSKVLGFMKQVARGLQVEGNFGTAHVYRSNPDVVPIHKSPDVVLQIENTLLASKEFGLIPF